MKMSDKIIHNNEVAIIVAFVAGLIWGTILGILL